LCTTHASPRISQVNAPTADRQTLNALDRLMLAVHDGLVAVGHYGFVCQTHVWLAGRVDVPALQRALNQLNQRYPVMTARLRSPVIGKPFWKFRADAAPTIIETDLAGSDPTTVWQYAETLCHQPLPLRDVDPLQWHLLHLPDGRDVLVMLFSHALMDGKAPEHVLKQLNSIANDAQPKNDSIDEAGKDALTTHLRKTPKLKRVRLAFRRLFHEMRYSRRAATLTACPRRWNGDRFRIYVHQLDETDTAAAVQRVRRLCGFPNLSPAVLAAVFRALDALGSGVRDNKLRFRTDIPLNLRPPGSSEPLFRNFMSFIKMGATREDLRDANELVRKLNAGMRNEIRRGIDLGGLEMIDAVAPFSFLVKPTLRLSAGKVPSLGFGFLGPVLPDLKSLLDVDIDWLYTMNMAVSPPGITLQAHQFGPRLNLVLTYIDAAVSESEARRFCEFVANELVGRDAGA